MLNISVKKSDISSLGLISGGGKAISHRDFAKLSDEEKEEGSRSCFLLECRGRDERSLRVGFGRSIGQADAVTGR